MRRGAVSLVVLLVAGTAAASHDAVEDGSTSTGDRDGYPNPLEVGCGDTLSDWRVTLELHGPGPRDLVRLRYGRPGDLVVHVGTIASALTPTVSITVGHSDYCTPPMTVEGVLVDGTLAYTIRYEALDW